jgi:hypothetical protein
MPVNASYASGFIIEIAEPLEMRVVSLCAEHGSDEPIVNMGNVSIPLPLLTSLTQVLSTYANTGASREVRARADLLSAKVIFEFADSEQAEPTRFLEIGFAELAGLDYTRIMQCVVVALAARGL